MTLRASVTATGLEQHGSVATEFLTEMRAGGRDYVLRAGPKGMPKGVASFSLWVGMIVHIRRWITRKRSWIIRVRVREEDPLGKALYEEEVPDAQTASQRLDALSNAMRAGGMPWLEGHRRT